MSLRFPGLHAWSLLPLRPLQPWHLTLTLWLLPAARNCQHLSVQWEMPCGIPLSGLRVPLQKPWTVSAKGRPFDMLLFQMRCQLFYTTKVKESGREVGKNMHWSYHINAHTGTIVVTERHIFHEKKCIANCGLNAIQFISACYEWTYFHPLLAHNLWTISLSLLNFISDGSIFVCLRFCHIFSWSVLFQNASCKHCPRMQISFSATEAAHFLPPAADVTGVLCFVSLRVSKFFMAGL